MPLEYVDVSRYKPGKYGGARWNEFSGGLNKLLKEQEIGENDLANSVNLILKGRGVPTKRWGTENYFLAGSTGKVLDLEGYYTTSSNELLALTDEGYLVKRSGASYSILAGASWASTNEGDMTQLNKKMYVVSDTKELTKYDGTDLTRFTALSTPTGVTATNLSGVSGTFTYSWRVAAEGFVGETLASNTVSLANLPQDISDTTVGLTWTTASPASSVKGYTIYGRDSGNERFMARVSSAELSYEDNGSDTPAILAAPPTADSTGGPIAKFIERHDNRLIIAGITGQPDRVMISGKAGFSELFHWSRGGAYIEVETDSGDNITGIKSYQNKLIIFKERSIWQINLTEQSFGNYTLTVPTAILITAAHGCISNRTITAVENDLFFLSREGVFVLGNEPNIQNVLRTNELSAKIRPLIEEKNYADLQSASAAYINKKYILSFKNTKKSLSYDRERLGWTGNWTTPYGISVLTKWYDSGTERWLAGTDDNYVVRFDETLKADRGVPFNTELKTKKEDFGGWDMFKFITDLYLHLNEIVGQININITIETRDGESNVVSDFVVGRSSTNSGWGSSQWGDSQWGDSEESGTASDLADTVKRIIINKSVRSIQLAITTDGVSDNYELLGVNINAKSQGRGSMPYDWIVQ